MSKMKPILFNTPMTQAILDDRKSCTRRDPFQIPAGYKYKGLYWVELPRGKRLCAVFHHEDGTDINVPARYEPKDVLWVRETWRVQAAHRFDADARIEFKAGGPMQTVQFANGGSHGIDRMDYDSFITKWFHEETKWHPSIHMPKEAARIFLRITDVRVERLQEITDDGCKTEGIVGWSKDGSLYKYAPADEEGDYPCFEWSKCPRTPQEAMRSLWDSTLTKDKLPLCGWEANPWVWAYGFQKITKKEAMRDGANSISR